MKHISDQKKFIHITIQNNKISKHTQARKCEWD